MKVDANEMLFIKENMPHGMMKTLADNIGMEYNQVRNQFSTLKTEWPDELVIEARRLLKATKGLEYNHVSNVA